jgi:hypothetical protein
MLLLLPPQAYPRSATSLAHPVVAHLDPSGGLLEPADLTWVAHPTLHSMLIDSGARASSGSSYLIGRSSLAQVMRVLMQVANQMWCAPEPATGLARTSHARLRAHINEVLSSCGLVPEDFAVHTLKAAPAERARLELRSHSRGAQLLVVPATPRRSKAPTCGPTVLLTHLEHLQHQAQAWGQTPLPVLAPDLDALRALVRHSQTRTLVAVDHTALVRLRLPGRPLERLDPVRALAALDELASTAPADLEGLLADDGLLDLVELALAGGRGREGLLSHQDVGVSAYLCSGPGQVHASDPGTGKTAVALSALHERDQLLGSGTSLVVVPARLVSSWQAEADRLKIPVQVLAAQEKDFPAAVSKLSTAGIYLLAVNLVPHLVSALHSSSPRRAPGPRSAGSIRDLVVDEGTWLLGRSQAALGAHRLREHCTSALVVTGTPSPRRSSDLSRLVAFARGQEGLRGATREELGCFVYAVSRSQIAESVGRVRTRVIVAHNTDADSSALEEVEQQYLTAPSDGAAELARRAALLRLRSAVAMSAGVMSELQRLVVTAVSSGQQVLVTVDSVAAAVLAHDTLCGAGLEPGHIRGSDSRVHTMSEVAAFSSGRRKVLVLSSAAQQGLNLQAATVVISLDLPLSAAQLGQRVGRAARIGGQSQVYLHLITTDLPTCQRWTQALGPSLRALDAGHAVPTFTVTDPAWLRA